MTAPVPEPGNVELSLVDGRVRMWQARPAGPVWLQLHAHGQQVAVGLPIAAAAYLAGWLTIAAGAAAAAVLGLALPPRRAPWDVRLGEQLVEAARERSGGALDDKR